MTKQFENLLRKKKVKDVKRSLSTSKLCA